MNKLVYFLSLSAIVSLSCSLVPGLVREPALVEATGPILGMTVAASLDDQGQPVDPSFTYPADQPEMVVIVRIGEVTPGPLTFSWYRVTEAGDESLFEQTVAVEAGDAAFSTGLNPGIFAAGTYKVVATFAGQSATIAWDVAEPQPGNLTAPVGTSASSAGTAPAPGPNGTTPAVAPQPDPNDVLGPQAIPYITSDNGARQVEFEVYSGWYDEAQYLGFGPPPISFTIQVSPAITGSSPGVSRQYTHAAGAPQEYKPFLLDPCTLPGGSDLPGTSITVTAVAAGYEARRKTDTQILGDDTSRPIVLVVDTALPPPFMITPGDQIALTVTAEELKSGGSWQTGILQMQVIGPEGVVGTPWTNPKRLPQACDSKTWSHAETFTYTVPPNPPATIELCVLVEDYAGNFNKKDCTTYYTVAHMAGKLAWTGTITNFAANDTGTIVSQRDADLSLTLEPGGTLTGTAQITYVYHSERTLDCGPWSSSMGPMQVTAQINGEWTEDAIVFRFATDTPITATETGMSCGHDITHQLDATALILGGNWPADWDGQAYAADDGTSLPIGGDATSEQHWTIHLERQNRTTD